MQVFYHAVYIVGGLLVYGAAAFIAGHLRGQFVANAVHEKFAEGKNIAIGYAEKIKQEAEKL